MTLDEARKILADEDASDPALALEAIAVWARHNAIAEPRLLSVAEDLEGVAEDLRKGARS